MITKVLVAIEFYLEDNMIGRGFVEEMSDAKDRRKVARENGIQYYDAFKFPNRNPDTFIRNTDFPEYKNFYRA